MKTRQEMLQDFIKDCDFNTLSVSGEFGSKEAKEDATKWLTSAQLDSVLLELYKLGVIKPCYDKQELGWTVCDLKDIINAFITR